MNKFYRILSVVSLTLSIALWSCRGDQGPAGPQGAQGPQGTAGTNGTNGTNGKDGNANVKGSEVTVKVADWKTIDEPIAGTGNTVKRGAVTRTDANIKATMMVWAYVKVGTDFVALPFATFGGSDKIDFRFKTGEVTFLYNAKGEGNADVYAPQTDLTFSYIAIEKSAVKAMESAGVNTKNRTDVLNFLEANN